MSRMRVLVGDGMAVEVETAEDAARLVRLLRESTTKPTRLSSPASPPDSSVLRSFGQNHGLPGHLAATTGVSQPPMPLLMSVKDPGKVVFKNGHYPGLLAMYAAGDAGVGTEDMVKSLGLPGPKSLPPTTAAWGKRAKSIGLVFRELVEVDRGYLHGIPHTIYRLTSKGRELFGREIEKASAEVG